MDETLLFEIVTPAKLMLSREVHLVVVPGEGGNIGILPRHAPLLASLRPGTIDQAVAKAKKMAEEAA